MEESEDLPQRDILDAHWAPYMDDFGGSGWWLIRCPSCRVKYRWDVSS